MGQYIYSLLAAAVFVSIINSLSPDSQNGKMGKFIAFAGALTLALTMLSPLAGLLKKENSYLEEYETEFSSQQINPGEYYANSAGMALSEIYGTELSKVRAKVMYDSEKKEVESVLLTVYDTVYYDTAEAGEVLSEIYGFQIEVRTGG